MEEWIVRKIVESQKDPYIVVVNHKLNMIDRFSEVE
jgi:hypothetical protein